jgi:nitrite reductase/ring-hydroxylating ferredoxin subunit
MGWTKTGVPAPAEGKSVLIGLPELPVVAVFNWGGTLYCLLNNCPHYGGCLADGLQMSWKSGEVKIGSDPLDPPENPGVEAPIFSPAVQCPEHGSVFLLGDGKWVGGPNYGASPIACSFLLNEKKVANPPPSPPPPLYTTAYPVQYFPRRGETEIEIDFDNPISAASCGSPAGLPCAHKAEPQ